MAQGDGMMVAAIAAAKSAGDGNATISRLADDHAVAPVQTGIAERQPAQPIVGMRVDSRLIKQQIRLEARQNFGQYFIQQGEICIIADRVG